MKIKQSTLVNFDALARNLQTQNHDVTHCQITSSSKIHFSLHGAWGL